MGENLKLEQVEVETCKVEEAEMTANSGVEESELDEMWSFVRNKKNPCWLWHAIDRSIGQVLAYVFGRRKDEIFRALKKLLEPFGIQKYCTDGWEHTREIFRKTSTRLGRERHENFERKHLNLRTRIKRLQRKTICFSKIKEMHDLVIGLSIDMSLV